MSVAALHGFLLGSWGFIKRCLVCQLFTSVANGAWLKEKKSTVQPNIKYPQRKKK